MSHKTVPQKTQDSKKSAKDINLVEGKVDFTPDYFPVPYLNLNCF